MIFFQIITCVWIFWGLYVLVMGLYRAHLQGRLSDAVYILGAPFILLGFAIDVAMNLTLASIIFIDLPSQWLVTTRLIKYVKEGHGWRCTMANWICSKLLDIFDPSGDHC